MEIQKVRGYCILLDMKCTDVLYVAEEMDDWKQGPEESTLKKIEIDLSNFKKYQRIWFGSRIVKQPKFNQILHQIACYKTVMQKQN